MVKKKEIFDWRFVGVWLVSVVLWVGIIYVCFGCLVLVESVEVWLVCRCVFGEWDRWCFFVGIR